MEACNKSIINETQSIDNLTTFIWKIKDFSVCPLSLQKSVNSETILYNGINISLRASYEKIPLERGEFFEPGEEVCEMLDIPYEYPFYRFVVHIEYEGKNDKDLICKISLLTVSKQKEKTYRIDLNGSILTGYTYPYLIEKKELLDRKDIFLVDDCLTIVCEIMTSCIKQDLRGEGTVSSRIDCLSRDFGRLFTSGFKSDVDIIVEDQQIPVHSLILEARSPVFAAMLTHDMKERNDAEIKITDFSTTSIKYLLHYLYTGEVSEIENLSLDLLLELYAAANKYQVAELRDMCSPIILTNLCEDNVEHCALLAFQYNDPKIMAAVVKFFAQNKAAVGSELWQKLVKVIPTLPEQVLNKVMNN